jgi:glycosyltransferase involved in cell wall biosynthesis
MSSPKVSVIIPTYNGADYLGEAIQSVFNQTYRNLELIIVNDLSPDHTDAVVRQFDDSRLKYLVHQENQGAVAARRTGVQASSGDIVAFLDQDDLFHPEKLQTHVAFLEAHPEFGVTYNARFELEQESGAIRTIWPSPPTVTLADLVLGFPFSPSDTVMRRTLALMEDIWDQSYVLQGDEMIFNGAEIIMGGRLALAGCRFGNVGRALNYRRYHPRRVYSNLADRCQAELTCQSIILDDPRCPGDVRALRDKAFMNTYLIWAYYAFAQDDSAVGQSFVREAVRLNASLIAGDHCELVDFFVATSAADGSVDLETHLKRLFSQLPPELSGLSTQLNWAMARGYLVKGAQAILWNRPEDEYLYLDRATELGAEVNETLVNNLTHQILGYQKEFGEEAAQEVVRRLTSWLDKLGTRKGGRQLKGCYAVNQAFKSYQGGEEHRIPGFVVQAVLNDPKYLFNRGVLAILLRATTGVRLQ